MPVEHVPGFWDSLGQGFGEGLDIYQKNKAQKQQKDESNASLTAQLFQMGAVDSPDRKSVV